MISMGKLATTDFILPNNLLARHFQVYNLGILLSEMNRSN